MSVNSKSQAHTEGGWAENIDFTDENVVQKWIKRKTKQPEYPEAVKALADQAEKCIKATTSSTSLRSISREKPLSTM